jgi:undecaprenyl-diphosphatase
MPKRLICLVALLFALPAWSVLENIVPEDAETPRQVISIADAAILGVVEGITEFLPVSSTGHLVLAGEFLGLRDKANHTASELDAVEAYEIVIQAGAILAVIFLYAGSIRSMVEGLFGRSTEGRKLLINLICAFTPTAILGLLLNKFIKTYLQSTGPVIIALAVGGVVMIAFEWLPRVKAARQYGKSIADLTPKVALMIGLAQSIAMWPGTSRSMMTILGGIFFGLAPIAAAEFSFILGLPTLLAATILKLVKDGDVLVAHVGIGAMATGLIIAGISAALAVKGFVAFLNRQGFLVFGIYRLLLAGAVFWVLGTDAIY